MHLPSDNPAVQSTPAVSVVIPVYRCTRHIAATLDSVLAQTFTSFEVIVVNDGCPETESLERVLEPYLGKIKYIKQMNAGAAIARNRGVSESTGELIAFLDGDDLWYPDYLAEQAAFLRSGGFDMVYCDADLIGPAGPLGATFMQQSPSRGEVTVLSLLDLQSNVITSGTILSRSAFFAAGEFETVPVQSEDFHLWVRVARSGARIGYQEKVLLRYRVSDEGLSGGAVNRVVRAIEVFERIRHDVDLSPEETAALNRRVKEFKADLTIARAKSFLKEGNNRKAAKEFAKAASQRPTAKTSAAAVLSLIAPGALRRSLKTNPFERKKNSEPAAASSQNQKLKT